MAVEIEKASNAKSKNIKAIIYGKSATEKTRYACNGIKKGIIIDIENGLASTENIEDLDRINVNSAYEFTEALEYVMKNQDKYETLIIDSFSAYGELLFLALSDKFPDKKDGMNKWGTFDEISRRRFADIFALNMNVILIFLEEQVSLDTGFIASFPSYKAKKFKEGMLASPSIVLHSEKHKDGYITYDIIGSNEAVAKNRFYNELKDTTIASNGKIKTFQETIDIINKLNK